MQKSSCTAEISTKVIGGYFFNCSPCRLGDRPPFDVLKNSCFDYVSTDIAVGLYIGECIVSVSRPNNWLTDSFRTIVILSLRLRRHGCKRNPGLLGSRMLVETALSFTAEFFLFFSFFTGTRHSATAARPASKSIPDVRS